MEFPCDLQIKVEDELNTYEFEYAQDLEAESLTSIVKIEEESFLDLSHNDTLIRSEIKHSDTESETETATEHVNIENISIQIEPTSCNVNNFDEKDPLDLDSISKKIVNSWKTYPHICTNCNQWPFLGFESLYLHNESEHQRKPMYFKCKYCERLILCYSTFLNHIRFSHQNDWKLSCDICAEHFEDYVKLSEHRKIHKVHPLVHICLKCGRAYPNKSELNNHYDLSHIHKCKACKAEFESKGELETHFKQFHNFVCKHCNITFIHRKDFLNHQMAQLKVQLQCEFCKNIYPSAESLNLHKQRHCKPVKFKCSSCNKEFKKKVDKLDHERALTCKRTYSSCQCFSKFATAEKLEHELSHNNTYKCRACDKKNHKKKVHPLDRLCLK